MIVIGRRRLRLVLFFVPAPSVWFARSVDTVWRPEGSE